MIALYGYKGFYRVVDALLYLRPRYSPAQIQEKLLAVAQQARPKSTSNSTRQKEGWSVTSPLVPRWSQSSATWNKNWRKPDWSTVLMTSDALSPAGHDRLAAFEGLLGATSGAAWLEIYREATGLGANTLYELPASDGAEA